MIESLFGPGTIGFYAVIVLCWIFITYALEEKKSTFAGLFLITLLIFLKFTLGIDLLENITHNPKTWAGFIGLHFALGAIWSVVQWIRFTDQRYRDAKEVFLKREGLRDISSNDAREKWKQFNNSAEGSSVIPEAHYEKERIILWIVYWEFSFVWFVINDPIKRISRFVYEFMADAYNATTRRYKNQIEKECESNPHEKKNIE
jgi:hypothetical protein